MTGVPRIRDYPPCGKPVLRRLPNYRPAVKFVEPGAPREPDDRGLDDCLLVPIEHAVDLSLHALGVYVRLLSQPVSEPVDVAGLASDARESVDAVLVSLDELEDAGLVTRQIPALTNPDVIPRRGYTTHDFPADHRLTPSDGINGACLYRLFAGADQLLYVGISGSVVTRMRTHQRSDYWTDVSHYTVDVFHWMSQAVAAETAAILLESPIRNIALVDPRHAGLRWLA